MVDGKNEISCQLSLYPLGDSDYNQIITRSLEELEKLEGLSIKVSDMSTVIFGEEELVWQGIKNLYREADRLGDFSLVATFSNVCGPFCDF